MMNTNDSLHASLEAAHGSEPLHPIDTWLARVEFALRYGVANAKSVLTDAPAFVAEYALAVESVRGKRKTLKAWLKRRA